MNLKRWTIHVIKSPRRFRMCLSSAGLWFLILLQEEHSRKWPFQKDIDTNSSKWIIWQGYDACFHTFSIIINAEAGLSGKILTFFKYVACYEPGQREGEENINFTRVNVLSIFHLSRSKRGNSNSFIFSRSRRHSRHISHISTPSEFFHLWNHTFTSTVL